MFMINHLHGFNAGESRVITFPFLTGTAADTLTASGTSHSISLPSSIVTGEMIFVLGNVVNVPTLTVDTSASGNNWTLVVTTQTGNNHRGFVVWKIAEGSDVLTLTTSTSQVIGAQASRIADAVSATVPAGSTVGATTSWDAPNCDPAVSRKHLWLACYTNIVADSGASPTNYTKYRSLANGRNSHIWQRDLEASSEDPPAMTNTNSGGGQVNFTAGIHPP